MKDANGREWAKLSQLKEGDFVEVDGGFDCISKAETRQVKYSPSGLFIDCDHGCHFLSGEFEDDGDSLVGIYPLPTNLRSQRFQMNNPLVAQELEDWIKENFTGRGRAVRLQSDAPIPGEPFMSMEEAKELTREAVAKFALAQAQEPPTSPEAEACGLSQEEYERAEANKDIWWRGYNAREATLEKALQEAIDVFEGMNDDEINVELLPRLRLALSRGRR